jgi:integrase
MLGRAASTFPVCKARSRTRIRCNRRTCGGFGPTCAPVRMTPPRLPLERRSSWDLMQTYGERAGIVKEKQRFHALRHAIAVHLLDAGADVAFVQDRLGHANIQNTMVYMRYTTVTRDALYHCHP